MHTLLILNITCFTFGKNQNKNRRTLSKQVEFYVDRLELVGKVRDLIIHTISSQMWQFKSGNCRDKCLTDCKKNGFPSYFSPQLGRQNPSNGLNNLTEVVIVR